MKILLISDVHANLPALDAVLSQASYDKVLFIGDAVDYGPFPFEVYSRLCQIKATRVLGEHDAAAAFGIDSQSPCEMLEASHLTREKITLARMPKRARQALGKKAERRMFLNYYGLRVLMVHGSPTDELYEYVSEDEASNIAELNIDLIVLGHTHVPYEVKNGNTWVINPGSVGMPRDGDARPSYAILDTYTREIHFARAEYDPEPMLSKLQELLAKDMKIYEFLADIFRTGRARAIESASVTKRIEKDLSFAYIFDDTYNTYDDKTF